MLNYAGEKVEFDGCLSCLFAEHKFSLPCGIAYENEKFILSQDFELPIQGFFVVSPKKHIETFGELTENERIEIFEIVNKTIEILRENKICDRFDVIFEEKKNKHFHIWIMPRHKWMEEFGGSIINNIGKIFEYSKNNMRTKENIDKINEITKILKREIKFEDRD